MEVTSNENCGENMGPFPTESASSKPQKYELIREDWRSPESYPDEQVDAQSGTETECSGMITA